ncbi:MAG: hypothetical protein SFV24_05365 [Gemmatimonadales bacterium]|nr:hypothetical protein [Gemmatimonadales bacterium]
MPNMEVFQQQIRDQFAAAAGSRSDELARLASEMQRREGRVAAFEQMAGPIHATVIGPSIDLLGRHLPGSAVEHYRTVQGFFSTCRVDRTEAYPAFGSVTIGIERDVDGPGAIATYRMSIIPLLVSLEPVEQLVLGVDALPEVVAGWFASRLLRFLETYLRIGLDPNYQQGAIRKDPVCGMMVAASLLPHREHIDKRTYYFCSETCRRRFVADPGLYTADTVTVASPSWPR